jgi:hypothetical protein
MSPLTNLVVVAGHAVYLGGDDPVSDRNWCLQSFQHGEPPFYIEHARGGVEVAAGDEAALLVFSGGQTRREAGRRSEAESYRALAERFDWWGHAGVAARSALEEFARDSYENLLFSLCRFHEVTGRYPDRVTVVSWSFKEQRFDLHRAAIAFPRERFTFAGVNQPRDLAAAEAGEARAIANFGANPYGNAAVVALRHARNPFGRRDAYSATCPDLRGLIEHAGPATYAGPLPWG